MLTNCARPMSPTGGPRDTLPPVVLRMTPENGTRNFDAHRITIEFDEYVQLRNLSQEFFTSPSMATKPSVRLRRRGIRITLRDTLRENTTYALNFGSSISDLNEGNPLTGLRYVFSTGPQIDSMMMSGYTADALKGDSVSKTFLWFFDAALDSIPAHDSTMFRNPPEVIARAQNNGIFIAENLKPKDYRIYAVQSATNNSTNYTPGSDKVGILDGVYNPAHGLPDFEVWFDTTRRYEVADPQLYFRMFTETRMPPQDLRTAERPAQRRAMLRFAAPYPVIERLTFSNIDSLRVIREYLKPTRDSIALWFDIPATELPDTIRGEITYLRPDSLDMLVPQTQELRLSWRLVETRQQQRERERLEQQIAEALAEGREPPEQPEEQNPFGYKFEGGNTVNPRKGLSIEFDYPLAALDTAAIALTQGTGEDMRTVAFRLRRDTMNLRRYAFEAQWNAGEQYQITVAAGAFRDIAEQTNDSIGHRFSIMDPMQYARIDVHVEGKTPESSYILRLTDEQGNRILDEIPHARTGVHMFHFVSPSKVRLMVIEDMNDNGVWDTGSVVERRQPERVETYMRAPDDPAIETKANMEIEINLDMNELFAPVSIEDIRERLRREEDARLKRLAEETARRREQQSRQQQQRQQGGGFGIGSGMGGMMQGGGIGF